MAKSKREQKSRSPRSFMEARALGYTEKGLSCNSEEFVTPQKTILKGYVDLRCPHGLNPPLRVPFTAKYSYGRSELDPTPGLPGGTSR